MTQIRVLLGISLTFFFEIKCISYKTSLESLCISHNCIFSSDLYSLRPTHSAHGVIIFHVQYINKYEEH